MPVAAVASALNIMSGSRHFQARASHCPVERNHSSDPIARRLRPDFAWLR